MKRPSFQFYPGDWLMDSSLRVVSVAARGAWIDMLCIMHQADPYGHLKVNGKVILPANLARMIGATLPETEGYLHELSDAGVYAIDADGCIYSRRMIRDEELRQVRAAGGKLGGNPKLKHGEERISGRLTSEVKQNPTPSSSSSSSSKDQELTASPSAEPADPIFGTGLEFLKRKGVKESSARSFLGLLRKELRDDLTVATLLAEAERQDISAPQAWLTAAAKGKKSAAAAKPADDYRSPASMRRLT